MLKANLELQKIAMKEERIKEMEQGYTNPRLLALKILRNAIAN